MEDNIMIYGLVFKFNDRRFSDGIKLIKYHCFKDSQIIYLDCNNDWHVINLSRIKSIYSINDKKYYLYTLDNNYKWMGC